MWVKNNCGQLINLDKYDGVEIAGVGMKKTRWMVQALPERPGGPWSVLFLGSAEECREYYESLTDRLFNP